ncbi:hypothetical protein YC2023_073711 [Brassica napus]
MGGKRKRNTIKPNTSRVTQRPSTLPTQYDFVPRDPSPSIPPVLPKKNPLPKNNPLPSVRDYPPPRKLFPTTNFPPSQSAMSPLTPAAATSQPQQRQTQSTEHMNTLPPSQAAPVRASQSPHSSEEQNSHFPEEKEEDMSDVEAPVQPNLASDHLVLLNSLLNQPGRAKNTTVLSRNLEPETTWFGYDKSSLSRKITKILRNKFNKPFYSWTHVPRDRQENYFLEFAKTHGIHH